MSSYSPGIHTRMWAFQSSFLPKCADLDQLSSYLNELEYIVKREMVFDLNED